MKQWAKDLVAQAVARLVPPGVFTDKRYFRLWEERGFHATRVHFYEPVPDTRELELGTWPAESGLVGINLRPDAQIALLKQISEQFRAEYERFPIDRPATPNAFYLDQTTFRAVDAEVLFSFVRHFKPRRIVEIGSGMSSLLIRDAIQANQNESAPCEHTIVDPFADRSLVESMPHALLVEKPVQKLPLDFFAALGSGDFLFIDSSHVVRTGGDVNYLYLEVLPRLAPGVIIHAHDIFLPAEYPREWLLRERIFWTEQYLLQAFLAFNLAFEVLWAGSYMHLHHREELQAAIPSYRPDRHWPGSFWFRRIE